MRKAPLLPLLLLLAACSVEDAGSDDSSRAPASSSGDPTESGAAEDEDRGTGSAGGGFAPGPSAAGGATTVSPGVSGAGGVAGGGGSIGASPVVPSGASGESSIGAPGSGGGVVAPIARDPAAPSTTPVAGAAPQRGLTAGAWDDNLNYLRFLSFLAEVKQKRSVGLLPFSEDDFGLAQEKFNDPRSARQKLDVALLVDTTGSMGDEIAYLQSEFSALSSAIEAAYPGAEQRWALVAYKDRADEYLTRFFDFSSEPMAFRGKLAELSAAGGGDFPEAPDAAFEVLSQFSWRTTDDVARLAFWVADAPHHDEKAEALAKGIRTSQGLGVHVYPVASSGIDDFTELTMRSAAQLTGGRYLFLTNDSGIGGNHKEPSIPCYFVTSLRDAITRMVEIELSGTYREPEASQILRTGGNPKDGACKLESGTTLQVF